MLTSLFFVLQETIFFNSPQMNPDVEGLPRPAQEGQLWPSGIMGGDEEETGGGTRRTILKWETDEALGANATISAVLYVNLNFPNLRKEHPGQLKFIFKKKNKGRCRSVLVFITTSPTP